MKTTHYQFSEISNNTTPASSSPLIPKADRASQDCRSECHARPPSSVPVKKQHEGPAEQEAHRVEAGEVVTKRDDSQAHQEKQHRQARCRNKSENGENPSACAIHPAMLCLNP